METTKDIKRSKAKGNSFIKGFNFRSITGIFYLLLTYMKKQWLFFTIILISTFSYVFAVPSIINSGYMDFEEKSNSINLFISLGTIMGIIFITLFTAPIALTNINSSTMIKRIGATRLNERGYVLIVYLFYSIIALLYFWISLLIWEIVLLIVGGAQYVNISFMYFFYSIFVILMFTSIAIFIGTLPFGKVLQIILSMILFAYFMIFSGVITYLPSLFSIGFPIVNAILTLINPMTASYYVLTLISQSMDSGAILAFGFIYNICLTLTFIALSMTLMSFNKVK